MPLDIHDIADFDTEYRLVRVLSQGSAILRTPLAGEVCISITNPRQSHPELEGYVDLLRLGFHDADREGGNFTVMSPAQARAVLEFAARHRDAPLTVHCMYGASRSVAVGLFLAAWLNRPVSITETDVLMPNLWVLNQLRAAALYRFLRTMDWRLLCCGLRGGTDYLAQKTITFKRF